MITKIFKYRVVLSVLFFIFLFFTTLHLYRYNFDVDGTGSMTIALRVYNHDWLRSINGIWSPLNSWIAALIPGLTDDPVLIFKLINAVCSIFIILLFHLITTLVITVKTKAQMLFLTALSFVLPVILLSYTHLQLSGDLLQLTFVLLYIFFVFRFDIYKSVLHSILAGVIIAAACYSKAFNLPFLLIAHFVICFITVKSSFEKDYRPYIKSLVLTYVTVTALVIPWIYLVHLKYGVWSFSTVQTFNFNWLLNDHSYTTVKSADIFMKPPYTDSPGPWEDPYIYYDYSLSGPFASLQNFIYFLKNIFHNIKVLTSSLNTLSFLNIAILVYYFLQFLAGKKFDKKIFVLIFLSLLVMLGYTLILVETRYIWLAGILLLITGSKIIAEDLQAILKPSVFYITAAVFCASFLLNPADNLQDMRNSGKDLYDAASFLQSKNLKGNFTAVISSSGEGAWCDNIAFISNNHYFPIVKPHYEKTALIELCRQNNISFLIYFYHSETEKNLFQHTELATYIKEIIAIPGKNAFVLKL